jgi:hypothetical protein
MCVGRLSRDSVLARAGVAWHDLLLANRGKQLDQLRLGRRVVVPDGALTNNELRTTNDELRASIDELSALG